MEYNHLTAAKVRAAERREKYPNSEITLLRNDAWQNHYCYFSNEKLAVKKEPADF